MTDRREFLGAMLAIFGHVALPREELIVHLRHRTRYEKIYISGMSIAESMKGELEALKRFGLILNEPTKDAIIVLARDLATFHNEPNPLKIFYD